MWRSLRTPPSSPDLRGLKVRPVGVPKKSSVLSRQNQSEAIPSLRESSPRIRQAAEAAIAEMDWTSSRPFHGLQVEPGRFSPTTKEAEVAGVFHGSLSVST